MARRIFLAILVILVVIQLFRPDKNQTQALQTSAIRAHYAIPADVEHTLSIACYDCHSNNTRYPWYFHIQPIAWWMADHTNEGKRHLNFDEFATYPAKKQLHKLDGTIKSQKEGWMPIDSYLWIHHDAKLSQEQKNRLIGWADSLKSAIAKQNNLPVNAGDENKKDEGR
jgi:hypothetical protein